MNIQQKARLTVLFLCLSGGALWAQQGPVAAGGEGSGAGGTVSFSIGQIDYITVLNPNAHITQGLQQPYEVFQYAGIADQTISLSVTIFPNPATESAQLVVKDSPYHNLRYELTDETGRVLAAETITAEQTVIPLAHLAVAAYYIRVSDGTDPLKTYTIIKH